MIQFIAFLLKWVAVEIASVLAVKLLTPKPEDPQPKGLSDFSIPTIDSSRVIPVIFGSVKLPGPAIVWYGDVGALGYKVSGQKAGFRYAIGIDLACCHGPVDSFDGMLWDEKSCGWTPTTSGTDWAEYHFDDGYAFGGDEGSGGVTGNARCYLGVADPTIDSYLQAAASANYPGLARVAHVVLRGGWDPNYTGVYIGTSTYIKPLAISATRCPNTLPGITSGHHRMLTGTGYNGQNEYDANPACMIYDTLTNVDWGLGMDPAAIDAISFAAAGETLYTEGLGLAMILEAGTTAADFIRDILRHIDGGLSADPTTGKLALKLVRGDYTVGSLLVLDSSCVSEVEFTRASWSETTNVVKITYTSRADNYQSQVLQWQDTANIQMRGETSVAQVSFLALTNKHAAGKVAARVLRATSSPLAKMTLKVNRKAWALRQADVFVLNWAPLGITGMVCRVTRPAGGELTNGQLTIECVEDAYAIATAAYGEPDDSQWVSSNGAAAACAQQRLLELPYGLCGDDEVSVTALASRASSGLGGFQIWMQKTFWGFVPGGGMGIVSTYKQNGSSSDWKPCGVLAANYAQNTAYDDATGFVVNSVSDAGRLASVDPSERMSGLALVLVDDEIMAYQNITTSGTTVTVAKVLRGVFDTVPAAHMAGAAVWFLSGDPGVTLPPVQLGRLQDSVSSVTAKLLPYNLRNTLPIASATAATVSLINRSALPMPPRDMKVAGTSWPTSIAHGTDRAVTWRISAPVMKKATKVIAQDDPDAAGTLQGTFTVTVMVNGTLKRTVTGITAGTWTWTGGTSSMQSTDCGGVYGKTVVIRVTPVDDDGVTTGTYQERTFTIT